MVDGRPYKLHPSGTYALVGRAETRNDLRTRYKLNKPGNPRRSAGACWKLEEFSPRGILAAHVRITGARHPVAHTVPWCTPSPGACCPPEHTVPGTYCPQDIPYLPPSCRAHAGHSLLAALSAEGPGPGARLLPVLRCARVPWKLLRSARTCQLSPCRWSGQLPQSPRSEQGSVPTAVPLASKSPLPQPTTPESPRQHLLHPSNSFRVSVVLRPPVRSGATAVSQPDPVPGYSALTGQSAASWSRGFTSIRKQAESDLHSAPV